MINIQISLRKERSEIVADAIRRVIYKQLPDFDEATKREIATLLSWATTLSATKQS